MLCWHDGVVKLDIEHILNIVYTYSGISVSRWTLHIIIVTTPYPILGTDMKKKKKKTMVENNLIFHPMTPF